jgi:anti-sigma B factor antagonist
MSSNVQIIEPVGILDSTKAEEFRQSVEELLQNGAEVILVDLKDITFIDSSGLGTLVVLLKKIRGRMLFELTSMDRVFELYEDRQAFEQNKLKTPS